MHVQSKNKHAIIAENYAEAGTGLKEIGRTGGAFGVLPDTATLSHKDLVDKRKHGVEFFVNYKTIINQLL